MAGYRKKLPVDGKAQFERSSEIYLRCTSKQYAALEDMPWTLPLDFWGDGWWHIYIEVTGE